MRVHQSDIADVLRFLPSHMPLDSGSLGPIDLLITTLGFEDRTSFVVSELARAGALAEGVLVIINYPTNTEENVAHRSDFEKASSSARGIIQIDYHRTTFSERLDELFRDIRAGACVGIDVSTCSSYVFYPLMRKLIDLDVELVVFYTEAATYYPTLEEWKEVAGRAENEDSLFAKSFEEADFQSHGVDDVYPYSIFSEMNPGNRASALVAVPNFNVMRMRAIVNRDRELNKTNFRNTVWVLGVPPAEENKWRIDALRRTNDLGGVASENIFMASTLDYREILETLEGVWLSRRYAFYISIASLGSKMQHVGTFIFLYLHQDVGIWLSEPVSFQASRFSVGIKTAWQVNFGRIPALRDKLAEYMKFKWEF